MWLQYFYQVLKKVKTNKETNEIRKIYTAINCKLNLSNKCFTKIKKPWKASWQLLATINKSCLHEIKLTMTVKERPAAFSIHLLITLTLLRLSLENPLFSSFLWLLFFILSSTTIYSSCSIWSSHLFSHSF